MASPCVLMSFSKFYNALLVNIASQLISINATLILEAVPRLVIWKSTRIAFSIVIEFKVTLRIFQKSNKNEDEIRTSFFPWVLTIHNRIKSNNYDGNYWPLTTSTSSSGLRRGQLPPKKSRKLFRKKIPKNHKKSQNIPNPVHPWKE